MSVYIDPKWRGPSRPMVVSSRTRTRWARMCDGCGVTIMAEAEHLEHRHLGLHSSLFECLSCALRNGRPDVAEPDVPEVPLVWDGIA